MSKGRTSKINIAYPENADVKSLTIVLCACLFLIACSEPAKKEELTRTVMAAPVQASDGQTSHLLSGVTQSAEISQLSFEIAGIVETVNVNLGDKIKKGDILAAVDPKVFELAVKQRKGQLSEVAARFREADIDYKRKATLIDSGAVSQSTLDVAATQLDSLRDQVEVAQAQLEIAQEDLDDTRLVAPYAGTIAERHIEPSQRITPEQPAFTIQGTEGIEVSVLVPENLVNYVSQGDAVTVSVFAVDTKAIPGEVFEVGSQAQSANAFPVTITLREQLPSLQPGMSAEVTFNTATNRQMNGFVVPLHALGTAGENRHFVLALKESSDNVYTVTPVDVSVIELNRETALVTGNLTDGQQVVRAGVAFLKAGQQVNVADGQPRLFNE